MRSEKVHTKTYLNPSVLQTFPTLCKNFLIFRLLEIVRCKNSGHLPNLTSAEKIQLKLTWDQFVQGDNAKTGFDMFLK